MSSVEEAPSASLDAVIARWATEARGRSRPAELFRAAEAISGKLDSAADISPMLAPHCTLTLRGVPRGRSVATAEAVAETIAAQNAFARGRWTFVVSSWPADVTRGVGVRTEWAAESNGEGVVLVFHDIFAFDACGRVVRVDRTLVMSHEAAGEEMPPAIIKQISAK